MVNSRFFRNQCQPHRSRRGACRHPRLQPVTEPAGLLGELQLWRGARTRAITVRRSVQSRWTAATPRCRPTAYLPGVSTTMPTCCGPGPARFRSYAPYCYSHYPITQSYVGTSLRTTICATWAAPACTRCWTCSALRRGSGQRGASELRYFLAEPTICPIHHRARNRWSSIFSKFSVVMISLAR